MPHRPFPPADRETEALADHQAVEAGVRALLRLMGRDPGEAGLLGTPGRFLAAMLDIGTRPVGEDAKEILATRFDDFAGVGIPRDPITVSGIDYTSLCEHHLSPFTGRVTVSYVAGRDVLGLSKVMRLVDHYAGRPQLQERMTEQIAGALVEHVTPHVAVRVVGWHTCVSTRGVRKPGTEMRTSSFHGCFADPDGAQRHRFDKAVSGQ